MITRNERHVSVKFKGRTIDFVREQYMRNDIPCRSPLCSLCTLDQSDLRCGHLPGLDDVTHYLMPFPDVALHYFEVLDFPEIKGLIFSQTLVQIVHQEGGKRLYKKLCNLIRDRRKSSVLFANEFCVECYACQDEKEPVASWKARNCYNTAMWYYFHLDMQIPIIAISEDEQIIQKYENETHGIHVMTVGSYLENFWPDLTTAYDIYGSLKSILNLESVSNENVVNEYVEYLPMEVLQAGLKTNKYKQGILHVSKHHAQQEAFVILQNTEKDYGSTKDILISDAVQRNRAVHGDVVVVELLPKSSWRGKILALADNSSTLGSDDGCTMPTGRVVGVLQRKWRDYVASLPVEETVGVANKTQDRVLVIPYDHRIPKIRIITRQTASLQNHRIVVRIDSWPVNSKYPNGHFVHSLGRIGEMQTESMTILVENEICISPFSPGVMKEMPLNTPENPWTMDSDEIRKRKDLRKSHLICSIDPKGCEDVDDALSIRTFGIHTEVGVHIADVTYFVPFDSLCDQEAQIRGTTVYMANERYDMLPSVLSSDLCSLLGNTDRYAVSVFWTFNENFEVIDVWYGRTVIRSAYKLSYEVAHDILNGSFPDSVQECLPELSGCSNDEVIQRIAELRDSLQKLRAISHVLRARRFQKGALELESSEVRFEFEERKEGKVENILTKQALDVHETVEELMILANSTVAKIIYDSYPSHALLRRHSEPDQDNFANLIAIADSKGLSIDTSSNKTLSLSLNKCVDPKDPFLNKVLRMMTVQAMSQAEYFSTGSSSPKNYFHYGLALDCYTHFTSPIRRYADIVVHRLLLATKDCDDNATLLSNTRLQDLCDHINTQHRSAKHASKASQELFQKLFFLNMDADDDRRKVDCVIIATRLDGLLVFIPKYGFKGPLYLRNKQCEVAYVTSNHVDWLPGTILRDVAQVTVQTNLGCQKYHLFDHITVFVDVDKSQAHAASIVLKLLNNAPHPDWYKGIDNELSKRALIQEVCRQTEDSSHSPLKDESPSHKDDQKQQSSLYSLIEDLRSMALQAINQ